MNERRRVDGGPGQPVLEPVLPEPRRSGSGELASMTGRDDVLAPLARIDGLEVACLVDPASGGVLAGLPQPDDHNVEATAAGMADLTHAVWVMLAALAAEDDAEDLVVSTPTRHHIGRVVPMATGTVVIALTVDRARTALGMALRALRDVEASLGG